MQTKDVSDRGILEYLSNYQGGWVNLREVFYGMPENTPPKVALSKMRTLKRRGLIDGCVCGCRGDFEITDKGLALINKERTKPYTGYTYTGYSR